MNYEKRFKRLTADLLKSSKDLTKLIEAHIKECEEAEQEIYDIDAVMEKVESEKDLPCEPVIFPKKRKTKDDIRIIK